MTNVRVWEGNEGLRRLLAPVGELRTHPRNPRRGNVGAIQESLGRFGQQRPLLATPDGTVIAGNHTYLAAVESGWTHVAVVRSDLTETEIDAYLVADNRLSDLGTYDDANLADLLTSLQVDERGLAGTGYDDGFLTGLLAELKRNERAVDPDDAPPLPEEPRSEPGEVYELGAHRLVCGDCREPKAMEELMQQDTAHLLWTDPPYGVSYAAKNEYLNAIAPGNRIQVPIDGDHQSPQEMSNLWVAAFSQARAWMTPGAAYYVTGPQGGDLLLLLLLALRESGFPLRHMLIWAKNHHVLGRSDYHYQHEPIVYGWVKGAHKFHGPSGATSLWLIDRPHSSKLHPTMKPVELVRRSLTNSTEAGQNVLDPFAGSGTTMIAAEEMGRRCLAMEIDPAYCDVIRQRYADYTGQPEFAP